MEIVKKYTLKSLFASTLLLFFIHTNIAAQSSAELYQEIKKLNTVGSVLYVAAHPDDENTRLLAYLANELQVRTSYLSLTRGDGGQNLIGTEQGEKLGMIRTQELLAARRVDGAEQYFTRAFDFGFSKNPEETFKMWNRDSILFDVVWIIRNLKPDVIITRFPIDGSGGHGHHTASGMLAEEAFTAAADPTKFPEQLKYVEIWKAKRIVWNGFNFGNRPQSDGVDFSKMDVGGYNLLLGKSYGEIASRSRSQHRSQGFGVPMQRGNIKETFQLRGGDSVVNTLFSDLNFSWSRIPNSKNIQREITKLIQTYDINNPARSIESLLLLHESIGKIEDEYWKKIKQEEVEGLILECAGLFTDVTSIFYSYCPGNTLKFTFSSINRSNVNIKLNSINIANGFDTTFNIQMNNNELFNYTNSFKIDAKSKYSNPYWLEKKVLNSKFQISNIQDIGRAENEFNLPCTVTYTINNKKIIVKRNIKYKWTDPIKGELYRNVEILPSVSIINSERNILLSSTQKSKKLKFKIHLNEDVISGLVTLVSEQNISFSPNEIKFEAKKKDEEIEVEFTINTNNIDESIAYVKPVVQIGEKKYSSTIDHITYDHIPVQTYIHPVEIKILKSNILTKGKKVGYIIGAGDEIPEAIKAMGYDVDILNDEMLANTDLSKYDCIVAGIRLYNTNDRMNIYYDRIMNYISNGGNYVVQYNTNNFISSINSKIGPYPFKVGRERVTDENAAMNAIDSTHSILNYPNKITKNDYDNWVQERGLYFLTDVDPKYTKVYTSNDPGEKSNDGILIHCKYGKGTFTYTGIAFFRQLPSGVIGPYKLFANILSQNK